MYSLTSLFSFQKRTNACGILGARSTHPMLSFVNQSVGTGTSQDFCQTSKLAAANSAPKGTAECTVLDAIAVNADTSKKELKLFPKFVSDHSELLLIINSILR